MPVDKVLVTGATGFIGQYLVRRLVELGVEVHCLVRASTPTLDLPPEGVSAVCVCVCVCAPFVRFLFLFCLSSNVFLHVCVCVCVILLPQPSATRETCATTPRWWPRARAWRLSFTWPPSWPTTPRTGR